MAKEKSLSPIADELKSLVNPINPSLPRIHELLEKVAEEEKEKNLIKKAQTDEENFLKRLESSVYYQASKEKIEELKKEFSAGYYVDIDFEKDELQPGATFNIRHTGAQYRHITPVSIVERIINNVLVSNKKPKEICKALLFEIELFENVTHHYFDKITNDYIQEIIDFFKNDLNYTVYNVKFLIKLAAHFYNQILLVSTDNCISIPHSTNNCYLIVTFEFTPDAKKFYHAKEGSFISAQLKILDGFNKKAKDRPLEKKEIKQMIYTVFAIFDFLPLPQKTANPKGIKYDQWKDRYKEEPIERLCQVVANHLLFVLEAYANLWLRHKNALVEGFIKYLANGVSKKELLEIISHKLSTPTWAGLASKLNMSEETAEKQFTNQGSVSGFAKQYPKIYKSAEAFFDNFYQEVFSYMKKYDTSYIGNSPMKKSIQDRDRYESDIFYQRIEIVGPEIIYHYFERNKNFVELSECVSSVSKITGINENDFYVTFEKELLNIISENPDNKEIKKNLKKDQKLSQKFNFIQSKLDPDTFSAHVNHAISSTYSILLKKTSLIAESSPQKKKKLDRLNILFQKSPSDTKKSKTDGNYVPGLATPNIKLSFNLAEMDEYFPTTSTSSEEKVQKLSSRFIPSFSLSTSSTPEKRREDKINQLSNSPISAPPTTTAASMIKNRYTVAELDSAASISSTSFLNSSTRVEKKHPSGLSAISQEENEKSSFLTPRSGSSDSDG